MYHKILVPLDGSRFAERAIPPAVQLARESDAKVHLFTVYDGALEPAFEQVAIAEHVSSVEAARAHLTGQAADVADRGVAVSSAMIVARHAADEIVREAEDVGADLIVMTTHGRSGLRRWLIGSVAEKVIRASAVPVLLYPIRDA